MLGAHEGLPTNHPSYSSCCCCCCWAFCFAVSAGKLLAAEAARVALEKQLEEARVATGAARAEAQRAAAALEQERTQQVGALVVAGTTQSHYSGQCIDTQCIFVFSGVILCCFF
jgi:hypothetical protein